jgi:nucleotide-binding universal stress UspA family protein
MSRVLVCVDLSEVTDAVVEQGALIAGALGAEVRLLHVGPPDPDFVGYDAGPGTVRDDVARTLREEHRALDRLVARFQAAKVVANPLMVLGSTVSTILEQAKNFGADLLVLGSHGHGALFNLVAGSVTQGVLHAATVPVLVVPSPRASRKAAEPLDKRA